jgi:hypothetical protein
MRVFAIGIEFTLDVAVQRFPCADPSEHGRSAFLGHRQQRFDGTPSDGPN